MIVQSVKLNNGIEMPIFGLGTMMAKDDVGIQTVKDGIDAGYRHFDTALIYRNEEAVGHGIRDKINEGVVKREDIFIVTKLWCIHHEPDKVENACRKSLERLGLDYIDLYLMHAPIGFTYHGEDDLFPKLENGLYDTNEVDYVDTWHAMEKLVDLGLVKTIGISNFNAEQIDRLLSVAKIKPVNNQIECNPNLNQKELIKFCKERDIVVSAYCPLGQPKPEQKTPDFMYDSKVEDIGKKYGKTAAQVILRYLVEIGTVPIPKSSNKQRMTENINIFDFKLTGEDISVMDTFQNNHRVVKFSNLLTADHKYKPF